MGRPTQITWLSGACQGQKVVSSSLLKWGEGGPWHECVHVPYITPCCAVLQCAWLCVVGGAVACVTYKHCCQRAQIRIPLVPDAPNAATAASATSRAGQQQAALMTRVYKAHKARLCGAGRPHLEVRRKCTPVLIKHLRPQVHLRVGWVGEVVLVHRGRQGSFQQLAAVQAGRPVRARSVMNVQARHNQCQQKRLQMS